MEQMRKNHGVTKMDYTNLSNEELERLVNTKDGDAICELRRVAK